MLPVKKHPASYRDPSGYVFLKEGILYRQVNESYKPHYNALMQSGLYDLLTSTGTLISHEEIHENLTEEEHWFKTIKPDRLPFVSYPYEWCFNMWKDAALTTLQIMEAALQKGMILKDASAYNLQFFRGKMVLIDSLSFEIYEEGKSWKAYKQFCEHFVTPLALMHFLKTPMQAVFLSHPEGIDTAFARKLLPFRSRLHLHTYLHIHLQAKLQNRPATKNGHENFSRQKLLRILESLKSAINSYRFDEPTGVWSGYYEEAATREHYLQEKQSIVANWISKLPVKTAVDLGANEGAFSWLAADAGMSTISADGDHYSVNQLYKSIKEKSVNNIHPIVLDLSNPTPATGVNNQERAAFLQRDRAGVVMALALIHHLAISKNMNFEQIAHLFLSAGDWLIIEFVPHTDEKVQMLLRHKPNIYSWYCQQAFENSFRNWYSIEDIIPVSTSGRTLYLMKSKANVPPIAS